MKEGNDETMFTFIEKKQHHKIVLIATHRVVIVLMFVKIQLKKRGSGLIDGLLWFVRYRAGFERVGGGGLLCFSDRFR